MLSDDRAAASLISACSQLGEGLDGTLLTLFHISPLAYAISTAGPDSIYIRLNPAYTDLVGKSEAGLVGRTMVSTGIIINDPARFERLSLLDSVGFYSAQLARIRHSDGRELQVMISARRITIGGYLYDLEALTDVTEQTERRSESKNTSEWRRSRIA